MSPCVGRLEADRSHQEDPAAILDIKEDIREECSKLGNVTNVVLFDLEADGVVTVRFTDVESAQACAQVGPPPARISLPC